MVREKKKVSVFTILEIILIVLLALIMVTMLAFNFLFKDKNSAVSVFGYSFFNTKSVEMMRDIPPNTLIIAKASEKDNIIEGSAVLCKLGESTALIRVERIVEEEGQKYYIVRFDYAAENEAIRVKPDAVIAKAVWQIDGFGSIINFASSTVGIIISVVIPLMFIIAIQVARILSMRRLENEAAALDDIDDFISTRDEETPAPVTFTEPKFIEDVTGKLPKPPVTAFRVERGETRTAEKVLSVDEKGRAEYSERKPDNNVSEGSPLYTYDRLSRNGDQLRREPAAVGAGRVSKDELYVNRPTRIVKEKAASDEFLEKYAPKARETENDTEKSEPVVFTPHLSNIIPDSIAAVQEKTDLPKKPSNFDESVRSYYEKKFVPDNEPAPANEPAAAANIPEKAVIPKENIAPPKKKRTNKALEELMSIIDAEETKLKK